MKRNRVHASRDGIPEWDFAKVLLQISSNLILDHFNTTFIQIFYFAQILKYRKTLNAKTSDKN